MTCGRVTENHKPKFIKRSISVFRNWQIYRTHFSLPIYSTVNLIKLKRGPTKQWKMSLISNQFKKVSVRKAIKAPMKSFEIKAAQFLYISGKTAKTWQIVDQFTSTRLLNLSFARPKVNKRSDEQQNKTLKTTKYTLNISHVDLSVPSCLDINKL